jgi:hypothetical protein
MANGGGAADGAPGFLLGVGVAVGAVRGTRLELNTFLGWSTTSRDVAVQPSWNDGSRTFSSARASARAFLFELLGSRRAGAFELRAGGGVHVSIPQFEATYEETRCSDLLCLGPTYQATDTDEIVGSGAAGLLLSAGVRLPVTERLLVGLDLRWLGPATSRVGEGYGVPIRAGGLAASLGVTFQLGAPVPR